MDAALPTFDGCERDVKLHRACTRLVYAGEIARALLLAVLGALGECGACPAQRSVWRGTAVAVNGRARWVGVAVGLGRCAFAQAGERALASDFCDKCAAYLQSLYNAIDYAIETCYQLR